MSQSKIRDLLIPYCTLSKATIDENNDDDTNGQGQQEGSGDNGNDGHF